MDSPNPDPHVSGTTTSSTGSVERMDHHGPEAIELAWTPKRELPHIMWDIVDMLPTKNDLPSVVPGDYTPSAANPLRRAEMILEFLADRPGDPLGSRLEIETRVLLLESLVRDLVAAQAAPEDA